MAVCGALGAGKTTLLRTLLAEIGPSEIVCTLEQTFELFLDQSHPMTFAVETREAYSDGSGEITMDELAKRSLRSGADRVIVGELRGSEAATFLSACGTGSDGSMATIHASSSRQALARLVRYCLAAVGSAVQSALIQEAAEVIHLVVHLRGDPRTGFRGVNTISEVLSSHGDRSRCTTSSDAASAAAPWSCWAGPATPRWSNASSRAASTCRTGPRAASTRRTSPRGAQERARAARERGDERRGVRDPVRRRPGSDRLLGRPGADSALGAGQEGFRGPGGSAGGDPARRAPRLRLGPVAVVQLLAATGGMFLCWVATELMGMAMLLGGLGALLGLAGGVVLLMYRNNPAYFEPYEQGTGQLVFVGIAGLLLMSTAFLVYHSVVREQHSVLVPPRRRNRAKDPL